jgi:DNA repair photolyase
MPSVRVGVSLPTVDEDVRRRFEPRAASVAERLEVLRALRTRGVATFAVIQPMLPGPLDALADAIAAVASSASLDVLHGVYGAGDDFTGAWAEAARDDWQQARLAATAAALRGRGVAVWGGELPPDLV